jgi:hypothetical protein
MFYVYVLSGTPFMASPFNVSFPLSDFSFQFSDALLPQARVVPRNAARAIENMSPIGLAPGWFQTVSSGEFLV